jgi:WD40 repeat protein
MDDVVVSPNGCWLAAVVWDGIVERWDLSQSDPGAHSLELPFDEGGSQVESLAFSPDGRWLFAGGDTGVIMGWDLEARDPASQPLSFSGHSDRVYRLSVSRGGRWLVTRSSDNSARIYDLHAARPGEALRVIRGEQHPYRTAVHFSPDDRWLITNNREGQADLFDLARDGKHEALRVNGAQPAIQSTWFSPDGRWLVLVLEENKAYLVDLNEKVPLGTLHELRGQEYGISRVLFSPDSRYLVTYGETRWGQGRDTNPQLWDLTADDPSQTQVLLRGLSGEIKGLAFSADSRWLLVKGDQELRLWPLTIPDLLGHARRTAGRNLSRSEWERYFPGMAYRKTFQALPEGND